MGGLSGGGGEREGTGGPTGRDGSARALEELHFSQLMWRYRAGRLLASAPASAIKTRSVKDPTFRRRIIRGKQFSV